jgi:hypothetical protein
MKRAYKASSPASGMLPGAASALTILKMVAALPFTLQPPGIGRCNRLSIAQCWRAAFCVPASSMLPGAASALTILKMVAALPFTLQLPASGLQPLEHCIMLAGCNIQSVANRWMPSIRFNLCMLLDFVVFFLIGRSYYPRVRSAFSSIRPHRPPRPMPLLPRAAQLRPTGR